MPISAVMVSAQVYEAIAQNSARHGSFGHGYTYSGHPVAAAVALEVLKVYEEDNIVARTRDLAPQFGGALRRLAQRRHVGEVRTIGLIGAIELVQDKEKKVGFTDRKSGVTVAQYAQEEGLIVRPLGDAVAFCPPLIIEPKQVDELFSRFDRALDRFEREIH